MLIEYFSDLLTISQNEFLWHLLFAVLSGSFFLIAVRFGLRSAQKKNGERPVSLFPKKSEIPEWLWNLVFYLFTGFLRPLSVPFTRRTKAEAGRIFRRSLYPPILLSAASLLLTGGTLLTSSLLPDADLTVLFAFLRQFCAAGISVLIALLLPLPGSGTGLLLETRLSEEKALRFRNGTFAAFFAVTLAALVLARSGIMGTVLHLPITLLGA